MRLLPNRPPITLPERVGRPRRFGPLACMDTVGDVTTLRASWRLRVCERVRARALSMSGLFFNEGESSLQSCARVGAEQARICVRAADRVRGPCFCYRRRRLCCYTEEDRWQVTLETKETH